MIKRLFFCLILLSLILTILPDTFGQSSLTIEKIMEGERFTGYSPDNLRWSPTGSILYFDWNPEMDTLPVMYSIRPDNIIPEKVSAEEMKKRPSSGTFSKDHTLYVYSKGGDLYQINMLTGGSIRITNTLENEDNPEFTSDGRKVTFNRGINIFQWDGRDGSIRQITDFRQGKEKPEEKPYSGDVDEWLYRDQLKIFSVLNEKKQIKVLENKEKEALKPDRPRTIHSGNEQIRSARLSPDGKYVTFVTFTLLERNRTIIPEFVTESGYTVEAKSRTKVGAPYISSSKLHIYDIEGDSVYLADMNDIPGIKDIIEFAYRPSSKKSENEEARGVIMGSPEWSDDGKRAVLDIYSVDNKDRWIMLLDIKTGDLKLLDRQHDEAWIGGPGIRYGATPGWLRDNRRIYFQSEETGYSHLYTLDVETGKKQAVTSGLFEIYDVVLSRDKKNWYVVSNEVDPGIRELYRISTVDNVRTRLTSFGGGVEASLSPDEKFFALRVSFPDKPWELYLLGNNNKAVPVKVTESRTAQYKAYSWRMPEFIHIKAGDGEMVPARLYKPAAHIKSMRAVIFVHGAGYLQNAHKWWSSYFREYMFHNFLADNGYTVLDIDYRGSAGYGRDWRTAIYRHMGGRDLDDHTDAAAYLVKEQGIESGSIGIYGGSYGGFMTLMAMFTRPGVFAAGAALRPVTDWAHYNHGYTSNILNTPVSDSLAYRRSSPIYFAEGLQGSLLICHGMIDDNVHFQDAVRLSQRLIELGKDNWELAVYPVERHGFTEPSSWIDEYKRIFRLFESNLR